MHSPRQPPVEGHGSGSLGGGGDSSGLGLPLAARELLAGFLAGAANVTSGYPFDTVKVRLQSANPGRYAGAVDCARQMVASEGVRRGLFRGLSSPLVGGAAETGVNYLVYSRVLAALQQPGPLTHGYAPPTPAPLTHVAVAGALAGVALSGILGPTELVKCRMQQAGSAELYPGGPLQVVRQVVRQEGGVRGLTRGLGATLAREVPGNAVFFTVYEGLRRTILHATSAPARAHLSVSPVLVLAEDGPQGTTAAAAASAAAPPLPRHWLEEAAIAVFCGGTAGMIMWAMVLPIDVAKTRLQTATPGDVWDVGLRRHWGMLWREGGLSSLYSGLVPTLARAFPANACQWLAWELAIRGLQGDSRG